MKKRSAGICQEGMDIHKDMATALCETRESAFVTEKDFLQSKANPESGHSFEEIRWNHHSGRVSGGKSGRGREGGVRVGNDWGRCFCDVW